jgi:hypothetical protein
MHAQMRYCQQAQELGFLRLLLAQLLGVGRRLMLPQLARHQ